MLPIERSSASTRSKLEVEDLQILLDSLDQAEFNTPLDINFCHIGLYKKVLHFSHKQHFILVSTKNDTS